MATSLLVASIMVLLTFHYTLAQLTFSTDWGKRSVGHNSADCTPNPDTLIFLYKYLQGDSDYDGPSSIKLYHNMEEIPDSKAWYPCAHIALKNVNTGNVKMKLVDWNTTTSGQLLALGRKDKLYKLKALVLTAKGKKIVHKTFCKAKKLIYEGVVPTLIITMDYNSIIMGINIEGAIFEDRPIAQSPVFNPSIVIRSTELGPAPDTATYIQKLEREREAKERGANQDNRSFFAKYWMYIVVLIVAAVLSGSGSSDDGGGQNAR